MSDSDDDFGPPALSPELLASLRPEALAALQEVMAARAMEATGEAPAAASATPAGVSENWNLSQFWYSKTTSDMLAREILRAVEAAGKPGPIACLSCPSTFQALKDIAPPERPVYLFEYDRRFGRLTDKFVFYDYNTPLEVPDALMGACAGVVLDPPYLNAPCLRAFASTVYLLAASRTVPVMLCTGSVMCATAGAVLGVRPTNAAIAHEGSRLSNPFSCYVSASFGDAAGLGGWNVDLETASAADDK